VLHLLSLKDRGDLKSKAFFKLKGSKANYRNKILEALKSYKKVRNKTSQLNIKASQSSGFPYFFI